MNTSVINNQSEYDYRFISYLIDEVFSRETLARSAVYQPHHSGKFHTFNEHLYLFVEDIFKERTKNDRKRFQDMSKHINKRCTLLRQNLRNKK